MNYEYEVPLSTFTALRRNDDDLIVQTAIGFGLGTTRTGMPPPYLPDELIKPPPEVGSIIEFKVPVPPGVALVGWNAQWTNQVIGLAADGGPWLPWEPPLFPVGHNPNTMPAPTAANTEYREAVARMKVNGSSEFVLFSITWTLAKDGAAMYEAWIAAGKPKTQVAQPSQGERMLALAGESGVVEALQKLTGISDLGALGEAAASAGLDVAMVNFMNLAGGSK